MTNKILTFGDNPDEPRTASIGIYQRLYELDKQKKAEKELERKYAVDNLKVTRDQTIDLKSTVDPQSTVNLKSTVDIKSIDSTIDTESTADFKSIDGSYVSLEGNWMKFSLDIFKLLPAIGGVELKVYLYLLSLSYGNWQPKNICSTSLSMISEATGISFKESVSRIIKKLTTQGLVKRIFKADAKGDLSIYRVYLPSEIPGMGGKTKITTIDK